MLVTTVGAEPARIDIDVTPGEPVDFTVPVLDADGAAQPVAGWTLSAQVRRDVNSPALHTFTTAAVAGGVQVVAAAAETELWSAWLVPSARWTLWLTPPVSPPYLLAAGWVRLTTH